MSKKKTWTKMHDLDTVKKTAKSIMRMPIVIKQLNEFYKKYKEYKGNIDDHLKYSADPIQMILNPLYMKLINEDKQMIYEPHVRMVVKEFGGFGQYLGSQDTAYRPIRNYSLQYILNHADELQIALNKEKETEDYMNPDDWYDNMKIISKKITKRKIEEGRIPKDTMSSEQASFVDKLAFENLEIKKRGKGGI